MTSDSSLYDHIYWYRLDEGKKDEIAQKTRRLLIREKRIILALFFGSFNRKSIIRDIDIAIVALPSLSFLELLDLGARLEQEFLIPVDLVPLQDLEPSFRLHILQKGKPILIQDPQKASQLAVRALKEKQEIEAFKRLSTSKTSISAN